MWEAHGLGKIIDKRARLRTGASRRVEHFDYMI